MSVLTYINRNISAGASLFYIFSSIVLGGILLIFYRDVDFSLKPLYMAEFVCMDVLALLSIYWLSPRHWRGVGTSVLDNDSPQGAIDSTGRLHGNHSSRLEQQWEVSDLIIRSNYFSGRSPLYGIGE